MHRPNIKAQRLTALFILGAALFNRPDWVFGVPILYAYVFAAWLLLIALLALVIEKK